MHSSPRLARSPPTHAGRPPLVVVLSARDTLLRLGPAVRATGVRFYRVEAIRAVPLGTKPRSLAGSSGLRVDTVIVTSRHAVVPLLAKWVRPGPRGGGREIWATGPATAAALRRLGARKVRRGPGLGAAGIVRGIGAKRRRILYVRSDVEGGRLARELRSLGHDVAEVTTYRLTQRPAEVHRRAATLQAASVLVLSSPLVVRCLQRALGLRGVRKIGRRTPAVVLGDRTAKAALRAGFRRVSVATSPTPQRFARLLVRTLTDASD